LINKIIFNFEKFVATKKGMTTSCFSSLSFIADLDPGSEIWDPGPGIRDPGWVKSRSRMRDKHPGSATLLLILAMRSTY
jgi:hypothetical protein